MNKFWHFENKNITNRSKKMKYLLTSNVFDSRMFDNKIIPLSFVAGDYNVFFTKEGIEVANQFYPHNIWKNFSLGFMRETMADLEIQFWSDWGKYFDQLLQKLNIQI